MAALPEITRREVQLPGAGGAPVRGFLASPAGESPRAGVLFLHWGFGDATSFLAEARAFAGVAAATLTIDAPGYGAREGPRVGSKEAARDDARQAAARGGWGCRAKPQAWPRASSKRIAGDLERRVARFIAVTRVSGASPRRTAQRRPERETRPRPPRRPQSSRRAQPKARSLPRATGTAKTRCRSSVPRYRASSAPPDPSPPARS